MRDYVFMTDSDSDLPFRHVDEKDIEMVYMPYSVDGVEYKDDLGRSGRQKEYFDKMRAGGVPVTSALNMQNYLDILEPFFAQGRDVLFLAFSSQLSATINFLRQAVDELKTMYPERRCRVVDTLSISAPQTLLILEAYKRYEQGQGLDEVADWVEQNRMRAQAWITVDDLIYLKRGGRISSAAATMGTLLDLKPIIVESRSGKMTPAEKVRGRKAAIRLIAERTAENIENPADQTIIIMQADAPEDAKRLEAAIREKVPDIGDVETIFVGPVIGAHCGPGTLAACFMGKERPIE